MVKRSPVLTKTLGGHGMNWMGDNHRLWLCASIVNRVWDLKGFKSIRFCASALPIKGAIMIRPRTALDPLALWNSILCRGLSGGVGLYPLLSRWLCKSFPQVLSLWVWIEEA